MDKLPSDRKEDGLEQNSSVPNNMLASLPTNSSCGIGHGIGTGMPPAYDMYSMYWHQHFAGMYANGNYNSYAYATYGQYPPHYMSSAPQVPSPSSLPPPPPPPPLVQQENDTTNSKSVGSEKCDPALANLDTNKPNKPDSLAGNRPAGGNITAAVSSPNFNSSNNFYSRFSSMHGFTSFETDSSQQTTMHFRNDTENLTSKINTGNDLYSPFTPTGFEEEAHITRKFNRQTKQAPDAGTIRFNLPKRNNMASVPPRLMFGSQEPQPSFAPAESTRRRQQSPRAFMQTWKTSQMQSQEECHQGPSDSNDGLWHEENERERGPREMFSYGTDNALTMKAGTPQRRQAERNNDSTRASRWDDPLPEEMDKKDGPVKENIDDKMYNSDESKSNGDWPPSLKLYVQRCFASVGETQKDEMQSVLKERLTHCFKSGSAASHNWDTEPIPQLRSGFAQTPRRLAVPPVEQQKSPLVSSRSVSVTPLYNSKFSGTSLGGRGGRRGRNDRRKWSPPGFRRRSRSRSRTRSSSRSWNSKKHSRSRSSSSSSSPDSLVVRKRRRSSR